MNDDLEDSSEVICESEIPVLDVYTEVEDEFFDDWLFSLANQYGGF